MAQDQDPKLINWQSSKAPFGDAQPVPDVREAMRDNLSGPSGEAFEPRPIPTEGSKTSEPAKLDPTEDLDYDWQDVVEGDFIQAGGAPQADDASQVFGPDSDDEAMDNGGVSMRCLLTP